MLSPRILSLGHAYLSSTPLTAAAQPLLDRVSDVLHESSSIALFEGDEILYVARSSTNRRIMSVDLGIGTRLPAYCTSMGRVLLAYLSPAERDAYLSRVKMIMLTPRTIASADKLRQELDRVGRAGYAIVDQELEIGLRSIAVPVRDQAGKVVAAMNIGTHASRVTLAEMERTFLPELRSAAIELGTLSKGKTRRASIGEIESLRLATEPEAKERSKGTRASKDKAKPVPAQRARTRPLAGAGEGEGEGEDHDS